MSFDLERNLPQNLEAERLILAAVLDREEHFGPVSAAITPDDFSLQKHRLIWAAMREIFDSGKRVDYVTLGTVLRDHGQLDSVDGLSYVVGLADGLPTIYSADTYVRLVKEKSVLRRVAVMAYKLVEKACSAAEPTAELLEKSERMLRELSAENEPAGTLQTTHEIIDEIGVNGLLNPHHEPGISTPWPGLNNILGGGFRPGQMVVVGARPAVGKTAMAMNIAQHCAGHEHGTALYSLEMSKSELLTRFICGNAGIDSRRVRQGSIGRQEREQLSQWVNWIGALPLWIDDRPGTTVASMSAAIRRLRARRKLSLLVVDYLQLMRAPGRTENRNQEISQISRSLKLMAKEFDMPLIVLAQLNRSTEKESREPQLSDLRDSGSIEQDADTVMLLHRIPQMPGEPPRGETKVIVAKQRNGPIGFVKLRFNGLFTRFEELTQGEEYAA